MAASRFGAMSSFVSGSALSMSASIAAQPDLPRVAPERADHAPAIAALVDRAFGPGRFAKASERLREGNRPLAGCGFVALNGETVIGSVRLWPVTIGGAPVAFLGPLAVEAGQRSAGLGQELFLACR